MHLERLDPILTSLVIVCLVVQGLEVLDEATSILTSSLQESTAAIPEMAKVNNTAVATVLFWC